MSYKAFTSALTPTFCYQFYQPDCLECQESLGVETRKIPDDQLTASSKLNDNLAPKFGRLYLEEKLPHQEGSWAALHNDTNQWLQVDLGSYYVKVTRVATQGRNGSDQWVTQYRLQYGDDVANLQRYKEYNQDIEKVSRHSYDWIRYQIFKGKIIRNAWDNFMRIDLRSDKAISLPLPRLFLSFLFRYHKM